MTVATSVFNHTQFLANVQHNNALPSVIVQVLVGVVLVGLTISGNVAVIYIIKRHAKLHNVGMYLIASLAFCDALVGLLVMPVKTAFQLGHQWPFNRTMCDMWMFWDVSFCTASIMHLCAIGLDRLCIFTYELEYMVKRTYKVAIVLVIVVWALSFLVALPLVAYPWQHKMDSGQCTIPGNIGYTLYSTIVAFYLPLLLLIVIYLRMFVIAKRKWREKAARSCTTPMLKQPNTPSDQPTRVTIFARVRDRIAIRSDNKLELPKMGVREGSSESRVDDHRGSTGSEKLPSQPLDSCDRETMSKVRTRLVQWKKRANEKRERKAITTLFAILLSFTICWLPFFVLALVIPICGEECEPSRGARLFIDWLGYFNSALNPIIYALMNDDLRQAYKSMRSRRT